MVWVVVGSVGLQNFQGADLGFIILASGRCLACGHAEAVAMGDSERLAHRCLSESGSAGRGTQLQIGEHYLHYSHESRVAKAFSMGSWGQS